MNFSFYCHFIIEMFFYFVSISKLFFYFVSISKLFFYFFFILTIFCFYFTIFDKILSSSSDYVIAESLSRPSRCHKPLFRVEELLRFASKLACRYLRELSRTFFFYFSNLGGRGSEGSNDQVSFTSTDVFF